jgi:cytochrome c oxidase cbb3-type subunit 1
MSTTTASVATEQYNYDIVKKFAIMAMVWGVVGMLAGVYIASELAWPFLNFNVAEITFGRLRPVHTSLVIFGFGGSALFATSYYIVQRTCQARLWGGNLLPELTFWGWQLSVGLGVILYMAGFTQGRPRSSRSSR